MATRTAPLFTATANFRRVTLHLIDTSGDMWTEEMDVPVGQTGSTIEDWAAAYQAATQASLYQITDTLIRSGAPLASNAENEFRAGGEGGINITYKNFTTFATVPSRLIAPQPQTMIGDTDTPDVSDALFTALRDAVIVIKSGFSWVSSQFTAHRERKNNTKVRA